jgi:hypothetical protein
VLLLYHEQQQTVAATANTHNLDTASLCGAVGTQAGWGDTSADAGLSQLTLLHEVMMT